MFNSKSEMDGPCATIRCSYGKLKPKATWFNTSNGNWVCFTCAQEANRTMMQQRMKYAGKLVHEMPPPVCIPAQEYVLKLLSAPA
jgi:hypothetical protein